VSQNMSDLPVSVDDLAIGQFLPESLHAFAGHLGAVKSRRSKPGQAAKRCQTSVRNTIAPYVPPLPCRPKTRENQA